MTKLLLSFICFSLLALSDSFSQTSGKPLDDYFEAAKSNKSYFIPKAELEAISPNRFLRQVQPYFVHENSRVRYSAIDITRRKGLLLENTQERRLFVEALISACKDNDSGNSGAASKALTQFNKNDFSKSASDSLLKLIEIRTYHFDRLLRLAGFVESTEAKSYLSETLLMDSTLNKKQLWNVRLALSRMGDETSLDYCLGTIKKQPINTNVVEYLFTDLIYTRQPEAIQYLLQQVLSDEKNCLSANPYSESSELCAYRIIELTAPVLINFPLEKNKYGEVDLLNREDALNSVRAWIQSQQNLQIDSQTF